MEPFSLKFPVEIVANCDEKREFASRMNVEKEMERCDNVAF